MAWTNKPALERSEGFVRAQLKNMPEKNILGHEERTAKIEGVLEQMDKRLDRVEVGLIDLKNEFKADIFKLESKMEHNIRELSNEMRSNFKWLVGIVVGTWITTISALITAILTIIFKG